MTDFLYGLALIPCLALICLAATTLHYAFGKSGWRTGPCPHCAAVGFPTRGYDFYERTRISRWVSDQWHRRVTAKRKAHRIAWQAWHDALPARQQQYHLDGQKKYGVKK